MTRTWICVAVIAVALPAAADPGFSIGGRPAWFVTGGATVGGTVAAEGGGFVGGELSLTRLVDDRVLGVYADAYYDFGIDGAYATLGPELAVIRRSRAFPFALGVDGGAAIRAAEVTAFGVTGRAFVSLLGSFALYARYAYLDGDHVVQLGVTLKFPLAPPFGAAAP